MSAICGIYNINKKPLPHNALAATMVAIAHYGRDRSNIWQSGAITLGHQMTFSTPESLSEKLPSSLDENQTLIITADARIDNRAELIHLFEFSNPISDSQLILRAYQKWGLDCPQKLLGDFAFAIWDADKKRLFCARDYPGVRPFYYYASLKHFAFASDIAGVLATPNTPQEIDYAYLAAHLKNFSHFPHAERTFFTKIKKLPPAHAMIVDKQGIKTWAFWKAEETPEIRLENDNAYAARLVELYTEAVACRTRSAFPVGAHASSGLDSSSVAVLASRVLKERGGKLAGGFSWSPTLKHDEEFLEDDDRLQVIDIAKAEGFQPYFTNLSTQELAHASLGRKLIPISTFILESNICSQAENLGIRTMLSGWGGDELVAFNGRGFFLEMLRRGRWRACFSELKMRADLQGGNLRSGIMSKLIFPWVPDEAIIRLRPDGQLAQAIARREKQTLPDIFQKTFRSRLEDAAELECVEFSERLGVRPYQLALVAYGHMTMRVEGWAAMGARYGLYYAYPLLDRRIIEFALGIPPEMFMKTGWKRWLFRHSLEGILPDEVRWNKSKDDPALDASLETQQEIMQKQVIPLLLEVIKDWLADGRDFKCLDTKRVQEIITNQLETDKDDAWLQNKNLFSAIQTEQLLNPELAEVIRAQIDDTLAVDSMEE